MRAYYQITLADDEGGWAARQIAEQCKLWGPFHVNGVASLTAPHALDKIALAACRRADAKRAIITCGDGTLDNPYNVKVIGTR